jgi:hypothetical protein
VLGQSSKDRMELRISEIADAGYLDTESGQSVRHDRAVAAELHALDDQFSIQALARGGADTRPEGRERGHARVSFRGPAPVNDPDNFVDETVKTHRGAAHGYAVGLTAQEARSAVRQRFRVQSESLTK